MSATFNISNNFNKIIPDQMMILYFVLKLLPIYNVLNNTQELLIVLYSDLMQLSNIVQSLLYKAPIHVTPCHFLL